MSNLTQNMNTQDITILSKVNENKRDKYIKFYSKGHRYEILTDPGQKYTSVTT